jgi:Icc-related predicted phosphoesterase
VKLWIISDLHLEFRARGFDLKPPADADVCVVAGDVCVRTPARAVRLLAEAITRIPVVYVAGNHEFYGGFIVDGVRDAVVEADRHPNMHFLENETRLIDGILFAGATLWTDFDLEGNRDASMRFSGMEISDFQRAGWCKRPFSKLRPYHTLRKHHESREFLNRFLADYRRNRTVVVTHTAPSAASLPSDFRSTPAAAAFASNLTSMIETRGPELWVHGHVHRACDYMVGATKVICNPRGYPNEDATGFIQDLVVEI